MAEPAQQHHRRAPRTDAAYFAQTPRSLGCGEAFQFRLVDGSLHKGGGCAADVGQFIARQPDRSKVHVACAQPALRIRKEYASGSLGGELVAEGSDRTTHDRRRRLNRDLLKDDRVRAGLPKARITWGLEAA